MTKSRKNEALIRNDGMYVISGIFCRANACVCGKNAFPPRPLAANRQICKRSGRFVGKPEVCQRSEPPFDLKGRWRGVAATEGLTTPQCGIVTSRLRTALRFACAVFRGCALRFAPCARHSSPSGLRCSQGSLAMFLALLGSSYRPALRWPGIPGLRSASRCSSIQHGRTTALASSLAALPASLGLLRPVSRTARGLRAPLAPPPLRGFDDYGLFPPQAAAFVRPSVS